MYSIKPTAKFQKDLKRRREYDLSLPKQLAIGEPLPVTPYRSRLAFDLRDCRRNGHFVFDENRDAQRFILTAALRDR
jgi:hypothetical protein